MLGLILSNEVTSCILLPLSNGEIEVNDPKEKFLLLFWKKKLDEKSAKEHGKQLTLNCVFSVPAGRTTSKGMAAGFTINDCFR